jgi:hypothetical protein
MRYTLLVLALTTLTFSQGVAFRNQLTMKNVANLQFFVEPASEIEGDPEIYLKVPLPSNVVLGPPKSKQNIIVEHIAAFCDETMLEFNTTCSTFCTRTVSRSSHPLTGANIPSLK